jgi:hypothetical protein
MCPWGLPTACPFPLGPYNVMLTSMQSIVADSGIRNDPDAYGRRKAR